MHSKMHFGLVRNHMKRKIWFCLHALAVAIPLTGGAIAEDKSSAFDLVGNWESTIEAGKFKIRVIVKLTKSAAGQISGKIDIPDQGAKDIPVSAILCNYPAVRWEIDPFDNTAFDGKINS